MSPTTTTTTPKPDFVPIESITAFVFIGVIVLVGLIARCLALNNSTIRSTQSLDLVIYREAPKPAVVAKARRSSIEQQHDPSSVTQDSKLSKDDSVTPVRINRGPKNL